MAVTNEILVKRLNKLQSTLLTSGLQQSNPPLYEVINNLIKSIIDSNSAVVAVTGGGGGGGGGLSNQPYVTHADALASLPQSRQLIGGTGVTLDSSTVGQLIIEILLDQTFLTADDESGTLPNSRQLIAGTGISFDDTTPNERTINSSGGVGASWSVLTNGDATNPELIFAGGDVIMTHIP